MGGKKTVCKGQLLFNKDYKHKTNHITRTQNKNKLIQSANLFYSSLFFNVHCFVVFLHPKIQQYLSECPQKGVGATSVILLYFLATAVSWSLMRPKPSIMVSSVSLLSSIVIVDSLGPPLMHGESWSFGKHIHRLLKTL